MHLDTKHYHSMKIPPLMVVTTVTAKAKMAFANSANQKNTIQTELLPSNIPTLLHRWKNSSPILPEQ